jgi:Tol biopolymer transport system component
MKAIIYITLFLSAHLCLSQDVSKTKYYLSNTKKLTDISVNASYVFEAPNKKYICFTDESVSQVYLAKMGAKAKPKLIFASPGCGYFPAWTKDSKSILMKSKTKMGNEIKNEAVEYVLNENKIVKRPDIDYRAIQSYTNAKSDSDPIVYINEKLQLIKKDPQSKEPIVLEDKQCYQPLLSPDKKKVAVHIGSEIWVYDMSKVEPPRKIGNGLVTSWSMDSRFLVGFVDSSADGHEMTNSELYLHDINNKKTYQLTDTKDVIELNPTFSQDGKKIYYTNHTDGSIIVSQLNGN